MNEFEKIMAGIVAAASAEVPLFVHSQKGLLIVNASETFLALMLQLFQKPAAPVVQASAPVTA